MCTMEKVLSDAKMLVTRLREHDGAAESLIVQTQNLHHRVDAMKQYQDDLNELNELARHRPRANLVLSIAQENNQIRELQQENRELRAALDEHQTALELIMSKYREQVVKLLMTKQPEEPPEVQDKKQVQEQIDKICEMAAIMWRAVEIDECNAGREQELISRLQTENETLRQLIRTPLPNITLGSFSGDMTDSHNTSASSTDSHLSEMEPGCTDTIIRVSKKNKNTCSADDVHIAVGEEASSVYTNDQGTLRSNDTNNITPVDAGDVHLAVGEEGSTVKDQSHQTGKTTLSDDAVTTEVKTKKIDSTSENKNQDQKSPAKRS